MNPANYSFECNITSENLIQDLSLVNLETSQCEFITFNEPMLAPHGFSEKLKNQFSMDDSIPFSIQLTDQQYSDIDRLNNNYLNILSQVWNKPISEIESGFKPSCKDSGDKGKFLFCLYEPNNSSITQKTAVNTIQKFLIEPIIKVIPWFSSTGKIGLRFVLVSANLLPISKFTPPANGTKANRLIRLSPMETKIEN